MTASAEHRRLETIAAESRYASGVNADSIRYSFRIFERYLRGTSILELGPAEGVMTGLLAGTGKSLTLVEGSSGFCEALRARFPSARVVHSLFEDFTPGGTYDNIVLGHVLEHVEDPAAIVARAARWLSPQGRVLAAVPNSHSLHRQAAVLMGLIADEHDLNEMDIRHGHRRVFDADSFRRCFVAAGLSIEAFGGYWIKPLSNQQIEATWTREMLDAFMRLGEHYPGIAAEIYAVAGLAPR
jgi:2-polyprenyl-3-methyl-5-hydroxy-6-metoxy-1,4-benzoquinol methylase